MTDYSDLVRRLQEECCHMVAAYSGTCEVSTDLLQEAKAAIEALQARLVVTDEMATLVLDRYWGDLKMGEWTAVQIRFMRADLEAALSQPKAGE